MEKTLGFALLPLIWSQQDRLASMQPCKTWVHMRVDIALLTETKLTDEFYTHHAEGYYYVVATKALHSSIGGVALAVKESTQDPWHVESERTHGPNVLSAVLVSGPCRFLLLGAYLPPSDTKGETLVHLQDMASRCPSLPRILLGDLNIDVHFPNTNERDASVLAAIANIGVEDLTASFLQRRSSGWTWKQRQGSDRIASRCDYIMAMTREDWQRVRFVTPRSIDSDHRMVVGDLRGSSQKNHKRYYRR
jgi:exonuclease III